LLRSHAHPVLCLVLWIGVVSRHTKAELASRRKALEQRAKLGLLSEEEKLIYAAEVGKEESRRRQSDDGGGGGGKKGGDCVVM
jgi:hypothetical protein